MSQQTKEALDRAVQEHFADETNGALVRAYVLQVSGGSMSDYDKALTQYLRAISEGTASYEAIGLLDYALGVLRHNQMFETPPEDD